MARLRFRYLNNEQLKTVIAALIEDSVEVKTVLQATAPEEFHQLRYRSINIKR